MQKELKNIFVAESDPLMAVIDISRSGSRASGLPPSALRPATLAKCMSILPGCVPIPVRQFQPLFH